MIKLFFVFGYILTAVVVCFITRHFTLNQSDGSLELTQTDDELTHFELHLKEYPKGKKKIILDIIDLTHEIKDFDTIQEQQ